MSRKQIEGPCDAVAEWVAEDFEITVKLIRAICHTQEIYTTQALARFRYYPTFCDSGMGCDD